MVGGSATPRLPRSPRARRRLAYLAVAAALFLAGAVAQLVIGTTHAPTSKPRPGEAQVLTTPPTVRPTPADRREATRTLGVFFRSAVIRRDLARSWPLATAQMKVDTTYHDWLAGNLPVVPYPAGQFRTTSYRLRYSYRAVLGYDVLVLPKLASGLQEVYSCELHLVGGRWLVDFCYPRKTL